MKKAVSIGLLALLIYHTLAYVLVCVGTWWQVRHDLSERLMVYRSVDSIVEFEIPLNNREEISAITNTTLDGFSHHGHYYSVVRIEVRGNRLHIDGLETESRSFWQSDLLSFIDEHIAGATDSHRKANHLLKFLLKEYSPTPRPVFHFPPAYRHEIVRIPDVTLALTGRDLPVHSPPPEVWASPCFPGVYCRQPRCAV